MCAADIPYPILKHYVSLPYKPPKDAETFKDIQYSSAGHERQRLDLYLPSPRPEKPTPVIIFIHGKPSPVLEIHPFGTKQSGLIPSRLTSEGYAIASIDYRLSGDAIFPSAVEDCKSAVRWLRAHAAEHNLDPGRVAVFGESAGAHHASMLGVTSPPGVGDEFDAGDHLGLSSAVQGVVCYYGPSDFLQMDANAIRDGRSLTHNHVGSPECKYIGVEGKLHESPEKVARANPIAYLSAGKPVPPFFLAHGDQDHIVPFHQSVLMDEALKKHGVPVTFHPVVGADHVFWNATKEQEEDLDRKTDAFLASVFGPLGTSE